MKKARGMRYCLAEYETSEDGRGLSQAIDHVKKAPRLIDELFAFLMKQLSGNSNAFSVYRYWQAMCVCCGHFHCSDAFYPFVRYFFEDQVLGAQGAGPSRHAQLVSSYANFARGLFTLEHRHQRRARARNASSFAMPHVLGLGLPSPLRYFHLLGTPPVVAQVHLADGSLPEDNARLFIWPEATVEEVAEMAVTRFAKIHSCEFCSYGLALEVHSKDGGDAGGASKAPAAAMRARRQGSGMDGGARSSAFGVCGKTGNEVRGYGDGRPL